MQQNNPQSSQDTVSALLSIAQAILTYVNLSFTTWTSTLTGFSGTPTQLCKYIRIGTLVICYIEISGTSNSTGVTITLPFKAKDTTRGSGLTTSDNGVATTTAGRYDTAAASNIATLYKDNAPNTWTNVNSKAIRGWLFYEAGE